MPVSPLDSILHGNLQFFCYLLLTCLIAAPRIIFRARAAKTASYCNLIHLALTASLSPAEDDTFVSAPGFFCLEK